MPLRAGFARTVPEWKLEDRPARRCNSPDATFDLIAFDLHNTDVDIRSKQFVKLRFV